MDGLSLVREMLNGLFLYCRIFRSGQTIMRSKSSTYNSNTKKFNVHSHKNTNISSSKVVYYRHRNQLIVRNRLLNAKALFWTNHYEVKKFNTQTHRQNRLPLSLLYTVQCTQSQNQGYHILSSQTHNLGPPMLNI